MELWNRFSSKICSAVGIYGCLKARLVVLIVMVALASPCFGQGGYYRHMVFDNSITPDSYYYSGGGEVKPSEVERIDERLPVETKFFRTPPNALRVTWQSNPGGVWGAEVRELNFRNRLPGLDGAFLYLWCYAPEAIAAADLPMLVLSNRAEGLQVAEYPGSFTEPVAAGKICRGLAGRKMGAK